MAVYEVDLSKNVQVNIFTNATKKIAESLQSDELLDFLLNKIKNELQIVMNENLRSDEDNIYPHVYRNSNKFEIDYSNGIIWVRNDSKIKLDPSTWANQGSFEKLSVNYPNLEIDLAKLVEYGTGIVGSQSQSGPVEDWVYMMNTERDYAKGWYYISNGHINFTRGIEGKFIYYKLTENIKRKVGDWIEEYLKKTGALE